MLATDCDAIFNTVRRGLKEVSKLGLDEVASCRHGVQVYNLLGGASADPLSM